MGFMPQLLTGKPAPRPKRVRVPLDARPAFVLNQNNPVS